MIQKQKYYCENCKNWFRYKANYTKHDCDDMNFPQDDPEIMNGLDFEKLKRELEAEDESN